MADPTPQQQSVPISKKTVYPSGMCMIGRTVESGEEAIVFLHVPTGEAHVFLLDDDAKTAIRAVGNGFVQTATPQEAAAEIARAKLVAP